MTSQETHSDSSGLLAVFSSPTLAYNSLGTRYMVEPGHPALVIELSEYDFTFLSCGEVLFCSPDADFHIQDKI